jgi:pimeloyl-ACP methyl ester carboxylesterase
MTGTDLVVVLPGIMGSVLTRRGRDVWAPSRGALVAAVRTFGGSVDDLRLPAGIGDEHPADGITATALMPDLHAIPGIWTPVKGYTDLLAHLRGLGYNEGTAADPGNLLPVPYDWRLSNRYNGRRLKTIVEPAHDRWRSRGGRYAHARIVFVCHSMGGLVARWYIEREGGAERTRKLVTLGTPYRGAAKALVQLVNGVPSKVGRLGPDLTRLARSFPSMYQLLPEYACITAGRDLVRTTAVDLPDLPTAMVTDAMAFHTALRDAEAARASDVAASTHAIVGTKQATLTTVTLTSTGDAVGGGPAQGHDSYGPDNLFGDGTVPLTGAVRSGVPLTSPVLRRIADKHGNLQRNQAAFDEIEGILTGEDVVVLAPGDVEPSVTVAELLLPDEPLDVEVRLPENHGLRVALLDERGHEVDVRSPRPAGGVARARFTDLPPGAYTVQVGGLAPGSPVAEVSSDVIVWDPLPEPTNSV